MKRKHLSLFCTLLFLLSFSACKKKDNELTPKPDESLMLTSFVFEKKNNPQLSEDIAFEIKGTNISGKLKHYNYELIPTFTTTAQTIEIGGQKQTSAINKVDLRKNIVYTLSTANGAKKTYTLNINWDKAIPKLEITTSGNAPITSLDDYVRTIISIDGLGVFSSFKGDAQIRGRGNTTWKFPKKPYKFKMDAKASLLGMAEEKDWILLANYLDGTHLLNAVAMKTGQLMGMPYTNHIEPVETYLNGQYLGLYMLTEQIEVKSKRVNVGDDGILLQLERYYDEEWKFRSAAYRLPVMIMHPELNNAAELTPIKAQFEQMEALIARSDYPNNNFLDLLDAESVANYFLVYMLTANEELNHPKSTYLYKTKTGKWTMGPIWDFDWAFGYEGTLKHFSRFNKPLLWNPPSDGTRFFAQLMNAPAIKTLMKKKWPDFKAQKLPELLGYIDHYAFIIEEARARDYQKWIRGNSDFHGDVLALKQWLQNRTLFMDEYIRGL